MRFPYFLLLVLLFTFSVVAAPENAPKLLFAKLYKQKSHITDYWVSEKLDGVRAYWDGKQLISRQGNVFNAPDWFVKKLPNIKLDGELWLGRTRFDKLSGRVRKKKPSAEDWKGIRYMLFELPFAKGDFSQRLLQLKKIVNQINEEHIQLIKHFKLASHTELMLHLDNIMAKGGEGLMLHRAAATYKSGRHNDLLKVKRYSDAEAKVIAHIAGKGKFKGLLGSVLVEMDNKKRFKIGSGFSLQERTQPPTIGSVITYKYFGLSSKGIPRFASYMRIRHSH